jgi:signal transduction histidine kinase
MWRFYSLRSRLMLVLFGFTLMTILVGVMGLWFYQKTSKLAAITGRIEESLIKTLQLLKIEQDFFNNETINPKFYQSGQSQYLGKHENLMEEVKDKLYSLLDLDGIRELYADNSELTGQIKQIIFQLESYENAFQELAKLTRKRGFWSDGVEGNMREKIRNLESLTQEIKAEDILLIQRYEKDYIYRRDTLYARELTNLIKVMREKVTPIPNKSSMVDLLLSDYLRSFKELVKLDSVMGVNSTTGIRGQMRSYANKSATYMEQLVKKINVEVIAAEKYAFNVFLYVTAFMVLLSVFISYIASIVVTKPISKLSDIMHLAIEKRFSKDVVIEPPQSKDEIGDLTRDVKTMLEEVQKRLREVKLQKTELLTQYDESVEQTHKLKESQKRLMKMNEVKDTFFSIISHDLRSPLNTMTGFLQILELQAEAFSPDEIRTFAQDMQKSLNRILDLLENLLQWSRSQTGEMDYRPIRVNLGELAENNVELYAKTAQNKGISLFSDIDKGIWVYADVNMINFIFRNLISNAIKFSTSGTKIQISAEHFKRGRMKVLVRDEGIGMTSEILDKVFRPEEHISTLGTNAEKGTGFGLSLCKNFIERHQGEMNIESKPNEGTLVYFTLEIDNTPADTEGE